MKDCVRIIYYCHVQRSSGCRYEMSVCVPKNPDEKLRIDDINAHTCNPDRARLRRRAKPQIEDFSKPIEPRHTTSTGNGARDDIVVPYTFNDSMASFLNGLSDHFDGDNDLDLVEHDSQKFNCSDLRMAPNENLARFVSEFDEGPKQICPMNQPSSSNVWAVVDVDVVDFSKRPDPPFTHVFHAKDEASQYSYACPMTGNQAQVVADALLNLFFQFGAPNTVKLDASYRGTAVETVVAEKFPSTSLRFHAENRNKQGSIVPRREETMIRERIYAWLMENGKVNWFKHLNEIKYMHNSEWIEELGGTPMELFFARSRTIEITRKRRVDGDHHDDDTLSDTYTNNSNDVRDENPSLIAEAKEQKNPSLKTPKLEF